jgi:predicted cupin superfamily sugar epimerase
MFQTDPDFRQVTRELLGPVDNRMEPVRVVPANHWQAARTTGQYSLIGCTVGPGFEYEDFELLRHRPAEAERLRQYHPEFSAFV